MPLFVLNLSALIYIERYFRKHEFTCRHFHNGFLIEFDYYGSEILCRLLLDDKHYFYVVHART